MQNTRLKRKRKGLCSIKLRKRQQASQGMTAAIILIAFIITAAGIAFVILTLGSEMQQELADIGNEGRKTSSSALQVEGGIISGYGDNSALNATAFNIGLVLENGEVDLSDDAITIFLSINNQDQVALTQGGATGSLSAAAAYSNGGKYGIEWIRGSGNTLSNNELVRIYIGFATTPATAGQEIVISIHTQVAIIQIEITASVQIDTGVNFL